MLVRAAATLCAVLAVSACKPKTAATVSGLRADDSLSMQTICGTGQPGTTALQDETVAKLVNDLCARYGYSVGGDATAGFQITANGSPLNTGAGATLEDLNRLLVELEQKAPIRFLELAPMPALGLGTYEQGSKAVDLAVALKGLTRVRALKAYLVQTSGLDQLTPPLTTSLERIVLNAPNDGSLPLAALGSFTNLQTVWIDGNVPEPALQALGRLPQLKALHVMSRTLAAAPFAQQGAFPALETLDLSTMITAQLAAAFGASPTLRQLTVKGFESAEALAALATPSTRLELLSLNNVSAKPVLGADAFAPVLRIASLKCLRSQAPQAALDEVVAKAGRSDVQAVGQTPSRSAAVYGSKSSGGYGSGSSGGSMYGAGSSGGAGASGGSTYGSNGAPASSPQRRWDAPPCVVGPNNEPAGSISAF